MFLGVSPPYYLVSLIYKVSYVSQILIAKCLHSPPLWWRAVHPLPYLVSSVQVKNLQEFFRVLFKNFIYF